MKKFWLFIIGIAAFVLFYYCIRYMQSPVKDVVTYSTTYEDIVFGEAYIVRDEEVYKSPYAGTFYSHALEGERVGKDKNICTIYSGVVDEKILSELATIDSKITNVASVIADDSSYHSGSANTKRLYQLLHEIETATDSNNIERIAVCKDELNALAAGEEVKSATLMRDDLYAQRKSLESQITAPGRTITSNESGIYSKDVDGYETVLTPDSVENMTAEDFAEIEPKMVQKTSENDGTVGVGDDVCKVTNNHIWYVVALIDKKDVERIQTGSTIGLRLGKLPGEQVNVKVVSVSNEPEEQKKAVCVMKCDSYSEGAFSIRASDVEIIVKSYSGFLVPINAMRVVKGESGVMTRVNGKKLFKPCKVKYRDDKEQTAIVASTTDDPNASLYDYDMVIVGDR